MISAFLLKPHMARVIVGELHDQGALIFRERRGDLLDQLLLPLDVDRREELVFVDCLEQVLVLRLSLFLRVGKRRNVSQVAFLLQLGRAQICQFKEFVRSRHRRLILATWLPGNLATQLPSYPATQVMSCSQPRSIREL